MSLLRGLGLVLATGVAFAATPPSPVSIQADGRSPLPWRTLNAAEEERFHLGHAVFNTSWLPAGEGVGRRDGLGPQFNSHSCDSCHNSRRRGRGPLGDGPVSTDFVIQTGRRLADGRIERGHPRFGHIVNTQAIDGFSAEASIAIHYQPRPHRLADGSKLTLWAPEYRVETPDGQPLPDDLVLMPRIASQVLGAGLLEQIPERAILANARRRGPHRGTPAWIDSAGGRQLGRFGWQATEPSIASQTAVAFAREMGLSTELIGSIDCAAQDHACRNAAHGGEPEVAAELFEAVVAFQQLEALRRTPAAARQLDAATDGARLFARVGCADCHRDAMPLHDGRSIAPYTDLLLHDLGEALADRDVAGRPVPSRWRTPPLWGLSTALEGARTARLLHDGRARSIEEAIAWHGGSAADARDRYERLDTGQRQQLIDWVSSL